MSYRPNLKNIENSYIEVIKHWKEIDDELDRLKIGRKDTAFDNRLMDNMLLSWCYLDYIIKKDINLLSKTSGHHCLEINNIVHYGLDNVLREEYQKPIDCTIEKFSRMIVPIREYYKKKTKDKESTYKIASEVYISILGQPQLFYEGNHRSGSIIASWINLVNKYPPFVLSKENAIPFFMPAQEIKKFDKKSMWRSLTKLPKYKKDFRDFWEKYCSMEYVKK